MLLLITVIYANDGKSVVFGCQSGIEGIFKDYDLIFAQPHICCGFPVYLGFILAVGNRGAGEYFRKILPDAAAFQGSIYQILVGRGSYAHGHAHF